MTPDPSEQQKQLARALEQVPTIPVSKEPDANTIEELRSRELERERYHTETTGVAQDISERKKYALLFFVLSCGWLIAITAILMLQGFGAIAFWRMPFKLRSMPGLRQHGVHHAGAPGLG